MRAARPAAGADETDGAPGPRGGAEDQCGSRFDSSGEKDGAPAPPPVPGAGPDPGSSRVGPGSSPGSIPGWIPRPGRGPAPGGFPACSPRAIPSLRGPGSGARPGLPSRSADRTSSPRTPSRPSSREIPMLTRLNLPIPVQAGLLLPPRPEPQPRAPPSGPQTLALAATPPPSVGAPVLGEGGPASRCALQRDAL